MAYGKIKADTLVYDNSGSDVEVTLSSLGNKVDAANPTFTGTVTIPTPAANDNTTKAASTAYVQTELGDYALKASPTFTGTVNAAALTLSGNLQVNGTTTTVASTNTTIADNLLELNSGASSNANDSGIIIERGSTGDNAIIAWDESADKFTVGTTTGTASSTGDISITEGGLVVGSLDIISAANTTLKLYDSSGDPDSYGYLSYNNGNNADDVLILSVDGGNTQANSHIRFYVDNAEKGRVDTNGITSSGTVSDSKGDVRKIIQNTQGSAYTLVASDAGKHILASGAITVQNNVFAAGDAVTIVNNTAGDIAITKAMNDLYFTNDGSDASRTLATRGMATILFVSASAAYISGAGLS